MTSIREYVELGVDKCALVDVLKASAVTKSLPKGERLYVGIPTKSKLTPDGSDYGKWEIGVDTPVLLTYKKESEIDDVWAYRVAATHELWYTGNGAVTLTPWECGTLLEVEGVRY